MVFFSLYNPVGLAMLPFCIDPFSFLPLNAGF